MLILILVDIYIWFIFGWIVFLLKIFISLNILLAIQILSNWKHSIRHTPSITEAGLCQMVEYIWAMMKNVYLLHYLIKLNWCMNKKNLSWHSGRAFFWKAQWFKFWCYHCTKDTVIQAQWFKLCFDKKKLFKLCINSSVSLLCPWMTDIFLYCYCWCTVALVHEI